MRLLTFTHRQQRQLGILDEDGRINVASWPNALEDVLERGTLPSRSAQYLDPAEVRWEAPLRPRKIIAIGQNYVEHIRELGSELPEKPVIFAKFPSGVVGHGEEVCWEAALTQKVDWEVELAVVIGARCHHIREEDALECVFGYTVANDLTARDIQRSEGQWIRGKNLAGFCPLGPVVVTRDEIPDPHALRLSTQVNGETMQAGHSGEMHFRIPHLIAYCARMFTLEPGDVILTGTPSGVGMGMKPPRFLGDGDVVRVAIEGIGTLETRCRVQ
ncbi:MAG: fumarylacetoacetate hydrolase family protein [Chloroflexi bacterium]|nr:fumarylacetoacetate hydrolase family protein [Chloroflexota bacterium]MCY4009336.1 fumarylacetoacetate hydrolase family protein [Anaerolineaceae bacterium]MCY4106322.1 fumarylacetoacetate hydrolase family protein [Chloroflexota bacterium]